jgi:HSP20 family molecular chaperone IbpA
VKKGDLKVSVQNRRVLTLPPNLDANPVTAACRDGVLSVTLSKRPGSELNAQQVPIA